MVKKLYFSTEKATCDYAKTIEKSHGRYEKRECWVTEGIDWLHGKEKWRDLSGIAMILSTTQKTDSELPKQAVHYLQFSKSGMSASDVLRVKRRHWSIENSLHWVLDVDFGEDSMRMRLGNATENMNILMSILISLILLLASCGQAAESGTDTDLPSDAVPPDSDVTMDSPVAVPEAIEEIPDGYFEAAGEQGTLEDLYYDTWESFSYEEKTQPLQKHAVVYLSYGYDENQKYDVFYLMHGGWGNENQTLDTPESPSAFIKSAIITPAIK